MSKVVFSGTLQQDSALSVGGTREAGSVDMPLARDGQGRFTLPGAGLAGAILALAQRLYPLESLSMLTAGVPAKRGGAYPRASMLRVTHAHPDGARRAVLRQGVGIRHDTGARAGNVLYDIEVLPRGTEWKFRVEVVSGPLDDPREFRFACGVVSRVLRLWERGYCWLGAGAARGLGWCTLRELRIDGGALIDNAARERLEAVAPPEKEWFFLDVIGTVRAGPSVEGDKEYGLDALSVGAHAGGILDTRPEPAANWVLPRGMTATAYGRTFEPDHAMAFDGKHPFIPGSSLRGPLAHALSRELRRRGVPVEDPNVSGPDGPGAPMAEKEVRDLRAQYFGTVTRSARVLVRDAYLEEGAGWTAALLNHHAEDEFAGGPFESAKFTSLAVLAGRFGWRMVVECPDKAALVQAGGVVAALVGTVGNKDGLASLGMVPLGGRKWRGAGWAPWSVLSADEVALAPGFAAVPVAPPTSGGATPGARPVPRTAPRGVAKPPPPPPGAQPASCALQPSPVAGGTGALSLASLRAAVGNDAVVGYWLEPDPLDSARRGLPRGGPCMAAGPLPAEFECALLEARVFLGDGWVHLVSDGGTWRGVRMREVPGDAVTATTGHVVRLRDALRFGASVGALPEWLRWRRYEQGGRLVGWRLVANTEQQGRN